MATAEQLKSLIRSHFRDQREQFTTVALQVAAHEATQGHRELAFEIKELVERSRHQNRSLVVPFTPDLEHLIRQSVPEVRMSSLVKSEELSERLRRIIREYRDRDKLERFGMSYRRKILLEGPPGTGKTMTASVLATELHLPLCVVQLDKLITKFMGETSAKLRLVFDGMRMQKGVYFFDEFDAIGCDRSCDNDVGEMRRVLNAFLQFIEQDPSDSIIVAATNNSALLDQALFRRFDDVIKYALPTGEEIAELIANRTRAFVRTPLHLSDISTQALGLNHAEIVQACNDAIKDMILSDGEELTANSIKRMLCERKNKHALEAK